MDIWQLTDIRSAVAAKLIKGHAEFSRVSIDSRTTQAGDLFIALTGDNFDGHDFIDQVTAQGAAACILSKPVRSNLPYIQVDNTQVAFSNLARFLRRQFKGKLVGITGSCGKTIVKEILHCLLSVQGKTLATQGNYNNEIGTPLTLCRLDASTQWAVVEMGARRIGDISYLTAIAKPDVAIITHIAPVHMESFKSVDNIAVAKGEILSNFPSHGVAILPHASKYLQVWLDKLTTQKYFTFGLDKQADFSATDIRTYSHGMLFTLVVKHVDKIKIKLPLLGEHNVVNFLASSAGAYSLGLTLPQIRDSIVGLSPVASRLELLESKRGALVINDSYNANPEAVKSAIDTLLVYAMSVSKASVIKKDVVKRVVILGDMQELGESSDEMHAQIGRYLGSQEIEYLFTVGEKTTTTDRVFKTYPHQQAKSYASNNELIAALNKIDKQFWSTSVVLIKGSRAAKLEEVVRWFQTYKN